MIAVSACLSGIKCRYNGSSAYNKVVAELVKKGRALPVCPEILAGMPVPRPAIEIRDGKCIGEDGKNYTKHIQKGAKIALQICRQAGCRQVILKSRSPSCGSGEIYDGSFGGKLIKGDGIFTALLKKERIKIKSI